MELYKHDSINSRKEKGRSSHAVLPSQQLEAEKLYQSSVQAVSTSNPRPANAHPGKVACPLQGHNHEAKECLEFFQMTPSQRRECIKRSRVCYTCLLSKDCCPESRCAYESKVPSDLLCKKCKEYAKQSDWAPLSILLCQRKEQAQSRLSLIHI